MNKWLVFVLLLSGCGQSVPVPVVTPPAVPKIAQQPSPPSRSATVDDFSITILRSCVARPDGMIALGDGLKHATLSRDVLEIVLHVQNKSGTKRRDYRSMEFAQGISLKDEHGNAYKIDPAREGKTLFDHEISPFTMNPGESCVDSIFFEPPLDIAKRLTLAIDGEIAGVSSPFILDATPEVLSFRGRYFTKPDGSLLEGVFDGTANESDIILKLKDGSSQQVPLGILHPKESAWINLRRERID